MDPAGTRRRKADDLAAAVGCSHRFPNPGLILLEIFSAKKPAILRHPLASLLRERASIKPIRSSRGDRAIAPGQIRLSENLAGVKGLAVRTQKNRPGRLKMI